MTNAKLSLGKLGEIKARQYLRRKNYQIITSNFQTRFGEIDIICRKDDFLVFVEVKTRISDIKGKPYQSVTYWKLKRLKKAIYVYLAKNQVLNAQLRVDVISIELNPDKTVKELSHFENLEVPD